MRKMRLDVRSSGLRATFHLTLALKWFVNLLAYFYIFKFSLCMYVEMHYIYMSYPQETSQYEDTLLVLSTLSFDQNKNI